MSTSAPNERAALHMAAVLPNISHTTNLDDQYAEDATGQQIEVSEGSSPVPEGPGLGVLPDPDVIREYRVEA